ncbi:Hypothetical predicted protein [Mytilus galloprovincialis]|uniref:Uncharacterized protein n=1 Tax=Mytilus galloprovincialis TaxID=29158 RepID=A0A8B6EBS8_MYTGA|nr:Hypothetical predicted protein [Mytilus galloprovincialis]
MKATLAVVAVLGLFALNCVSADGYGNGGGYMKGGWSGYGNQGYGMGGYQGYGKSGGYHGYSGYGKKGGYVDEITQYQPLPVYGGALAGPYAGGYGGDWPVVLVEGWTVVCSDKVEASCSERCQL